MWKQMVPIFLQPAGVSANPIGKLFLVRYAQTNIQFLF